MHHDPDSLPDLDGAPSTLRSLERVLTPSGFPLASGYHLFRDAEFGRDALEVAEDLLGIRPDIARRVIIRLSELQGTAENSKTEEAPGKIHHEHRARILEGRPVGKESRRILRDLARRWELAASNESLDALDELTYYGTVDATPLFVRLVGAYCDRFGSSILDAPYRPHGTTEDAGLTVRDAVGRAAQWVARSIEQSDLGLLEWHRKSPRGLPFQAWKDGAISYLHPDGLLANVEGPIASIEVQGLACDALTVAVRLLDDAPPEERACWLALAGRIRRATIERFWMPEERYFALAIDRDPRGERPRQVKLISSNPGALLDSGLFDGCSEEERRLSIGSIVERVYSGEFLTDVGVRCSSLAHQHVQSYAGYQSTYTVWHKETYDIAKGLRRQGFPALARDLETRLLNAVNVVGGPTEFLYVMPDGGVDYRPFEAEAGPPGFGDEAKEIAATNVPENDQAWSISAALAIKWRRGRVPHAALPSSSGWQGEIEERKRLEIPPAALLRTLVEIRRVRETAPRFRINTARGAEEEAAYLERYR